MKIEKRIIGDNLYMDERKKHTMIVFGGDKLAKVRDIVIILLSGSILIEAITGIELLGSWWK